jgi:hypothetical protein
MTAAYDDRRCLGHSTLGIVQEIKRFGAMMDAANQREKPTTVEIG